ncbi:MAG: RnfABCDGE type electron transport complex subunit B [Oscillospiraceae bacterium]
MLELILIPTIIFIILGLVAGLLLSVFSKVFAVKTNEKEQDIIAALPGLNCGVCGFSGCENYAHNLIETDVKTNRCVPGGDAVSKKISEILGTDFCDVEENVAVIKCGGDKPNTTNDSFVYQGEKTCIACNMYYNGKGKCDYGCIGYGDCINECKYGAISIVDSVAVIDPNLCVGCTLCVAACPKMIIEMKPLKSKVFVKCSSCDSAKVTFAVCKNGCIACKKCEKVCPTNAITVSDNHAHIDYDKCTNCGACVDVCPQHCITKSTNS